MKVDSDGNPMNIRALKEIFLLGFLLVLSGLSGCLGLDDYRFICQEPSDCVTGYWCQDGECVSGPVPYSEDGDGSEGDHVAGDGDTGEGDTGEGDAGEGDTGDGDTGEGDTGEGDTGEGDEDFDPGVYVEIPAGSFLMGSAASEEGHDVQEGPQREVTITRAFMLKETPVTQGEWESLMTTSPSDFPECGSDCALDFITWWDAVEYLNRLSEILELEPCYEISGCVTLRDGFGLICSAVEFVGLDCEGYRLPTEAEWEYAARAETSTPRYGELDQIAWYQGNSEGSPKPVREKEPNAWGLYDMLGNVFEWTGDLFGEYQNGAVTDPMGSEMGTSRVIRGGSWFHSAQTCRAAYRLGYPPSSTGNSIGFRPARTVF